MQISTVRRAAAITLVAATFGVWPCATYGQENRPLEQSPPRTPETATEAEGFVKEPAVIQRAVIFGDRHFANGEVTQGWYIDTWNMVPGSGWPSVGPGYRLWRSNDRVFADASAAISWRGYKTAQARVEFPRLARSRVLAGAQIRWQDFPQVAFFGAGPGSLESNRSEYGLRSANLVGYATFRPVRWLGIGTNVGWLRPSVDARGGFFKGSEPDTHVVFPDDPVFTVSSKPTFVHAETSITADTRDFAGHPTRGGLYRAAAANFADRDTGAFSFKRYEVEAAQFVPLADSRVVLAFHGWLAASPTKDGRVVPFFLQPSLGGHNSLRSYADYRFHDRNLLLIDVESRIALMTHVDAAVFFDAGNVAARVADLNLDRRSYGVGLRLHSRRQTFARLDVARGREGWRFIIHFTDPLNLARLTRRTAAVPFVP